METNIIHQGDSWQLAKTLPPNSINLICCSPPYYSQRDYQTGQWEGGSVECDHTPNKDIYAAAIAASGLGGGKANQANAEQSRSSYRDLCGKCGARRIDAQAGLEATPQEFIAKLVTLFRDLRTALHPTGQCFINISDTRSDSREWLGIPHRLVFALQDDGWRYEDEIIWQKPNCMPSSQKNRFTRSHEFVFMLNKSRDAFFDSDAVREVQQTAAISKFYDIDEPRGKTPTWGIDGTQSLRIKGRPPRLLNPAGAMKRTVWSIATQPLRNIQHFAAYPEALVRPMIEAGSSAAGVCSACGAPWRRVTEVTRNGDSLKNPEKINELAINGIVHGGTENRRLGPQVQDSRSTTGWTPTCACSAGDPVPAIVLDPFMGSGTTGVVCVSLGRRYVGFELNPAYVEIAESRIRKGNRL